MKLFFALTLLSIALSASPAREAPPPAVRPILGSPHHLAWHDTSDADLIFLASAVGPEIDMPPVPRPPDGRAILDAPPTWRPGIPLWACQRWNSGLAMCYHVTPVFVGLPLVH